MKRTSLLSHFLALLLAGLGCCLPSFSQEAGGITQTVYNASVFNPGFIYFKNGPHIFAGYSTQWVGLQGAPKSVELSANSLIGYSAFGMGLNVVQESIGVIDQLDVALNLSYGVELSSGYALRIGLKAAMQRTQINYNDLTFLDTSDPYWDLGQLKKINPNIGLGAVLEMNSAYIGVSILDLIPNKVYQNKVLPVLKRSPVMYIHGGYDFYINPSLNLLATGLLKIHRPYTLGFEVNGIASFKQRIDLGLSYRNKSSMGFLAAYRLSPNLLLGYSYTMSLNSLHSYNVGSHQLFLTLDLFKKPW
ncbi:PorP/SprF family type IX secretion system membrane protein [Myroides sp. LJL115]